MEESLLRLVGLGLLALLTQSTVVFAQVITVLLVRRASEGRLGPEVRSEVRVGLGDGRISGLQRWIHFQK